MMSCVFANVSVGRLQGAAIAIFVGAVSVGRLQGAATANFLANVSVGCYRAQLSPIF